MRPYDHARPALWSHGLRWSWPSFSQRHRAWLEQIQAKNGADLLRALVISGFSAIWIDRFGLRDRGDGMIDELRAAGAPLLFEDEQQRYAILDLRPFGRSVQTTVGPDALRAERQSMSNFPGIAWGRGFSYREENWGGRPFRWSQRTVSSRSATMAIASSTSGSPSRCMRRSPGPSPSAPATSNIGWQPARRPYPRRSIPSSPPANRAASSSSRLRRRPPQLVINASLPSR